MFFLAWKAEGNRYFQEQDSLILLKQHPSTLNTIAHISKVLSLAFAQLQISQCLP